MRTSMWYKEERMKKFIENSNNFYMFSLLMMVDIWSSGWERESCKHNYNYKLHVFFLLLTTMKLIWQVVGTPKSSSLIKGQHEFHLCTIEFEPKTFWGPNVPKRVIPMNHHPKVKLHFNHSNLNCTIHDFTKRNKRNNWRVHKILFPFIEFKKHAHLE